MADKEFEARAGKRSLKYMVEKVSNGSYIKYKVYRRDPSGVFFKWDSVDETESFDAVRDIIKSDFAMGDEDVKVTEI